jgi:PAS domain S-box-containing protein
MTTRPASGSERVLILAPHGRDASIASAILREAGYPVAVCADLSRLREELDREAGVALVVEEALQTAEYPDLVRWIEGQPPWSDFPIVLLAHRGGGLERNPAAGRLSAALGNVTFLERPFHPTTLVSVMETALRGRRRQYEARDRIEAMKAAEERFRTLAETIPQLAWMANADGAISWYNRRWYDYTGTTPEDMLASSSPEGLVPADYIGRVRESFAAAVRSGEPWQELFPIRGADGEYRWFLSRASPFHDADHRITGWFGTNTDVTEQQAAEELLERRVEERTSELEAANRQLADQIVERERIESALRQAQRLEAVGQLTSGVAHDFNNLLMVVLGNIRQMQKADMEPATSRRLHMMAQAAERGAQLTAQMLAFSRRQALEPRAVDLNETVLSMHDLLQSTMGGSVRIETVLHPNLWPAMIDPTQIELVILNLAINARDAMAVGGSLLVETANVSLGEPDRAEAPPAGEYVMVAVTDTGSGMTPEVLAKVFEPFFTTKEVGKGSGLGLSQVFGLAKQSGGGVCIDSAPGAGTSVKVYLPRAFARPDLMPDHAVDAPDASPKDARVLVVDDDSAVREVTASMLTELGYSVVEAGSGGAALDLLDGQGEIDVLLLDFAMPGMNGAEVAREARARRPNVPILFLTGYADAEALIDAGEDGILRKPFHEKDLATKLRTILRQAG